MNFTSNSYLMNNQKPVSTPWTQNPSKPVMNNPLSQYQSSSTSNTNSSMNTANSNMINGFSSNQGSLNNFQNSSTLQHQPSISTFNAPGNISTLNTNSFNSNPLGFGSLNNPLLNNQPSQSQNNPLGFNMNTMNNTINNTSSNQNQMQNNNQSNFLGSGINNPLQSFNNNQGSVNPLNQQLNANQQLNFSFGHKPDTDKNSSNQSNFTFGVNNFSSNVNGQSTNPLQSLQSQNLNQSQSLQPNQLSFGFNNKIPVTQTQQPFQGTVYSDDHTKVLKLVELYNRSFLTNDELNQFKFNFYDSKPSQMGNMQPIYQRAVSVNGEINLIDKDLFDKAVQNNPNPNELYPVQISSVCQLLRRLEMEEKEFLNWKAIQEGINNKIRTFQNKYSFINKTSYKETDNRLNRITKDAMFMLYKNILDLDRYQYNRELTAQLNKISSSVTNKLLYDNLQNYESKPSSIVVKLSNLHQRNNQQPSKESKCSHKYEKYKELFSLLESSYSRVINNIRKANEELQFIINDCDSLMRYDKVLN